MDLVLPSTALLWQLLALVPQQPAQPQTSGGFAASVLIAFLAIGLLAIVAKFATTKPRRRRPRR